MKPKDIRDLNTEEIKARIKNDADQLLRLRLNHAVSAIENPSKIRALRHDLARLKTILREREMAEAQTN